MMWYVEFNFIETSRGRIPTEIKQFYTESDAVTFAELETNDGEIGYMGEE